MDPAQPTTERECVAFVRHTRWPDGVRCPYCDSDSVLLMTTRYRQHFCRWRCRACGRYFCDTTATGLHQLKIPVTALFQALYLLAAGYTQADIAARLGISRRCICRIKRRTAECSLYRALQQRLIDAPPAFLQDLPPPAQPEDPPERSENPALGAQRGSPQPPVPSPQRLAAPNQTMLDRYYLSRIMTPCDPIPERNPPCSESTTSTASRKPSPGSMTNSETSR